MASQATAQIEAMQKAIASMQQAISVLQIQVDQAQLIEAKQDELDPELEKPVYQSQESSLSQKVPPARWECDLCSMPICPGTPSTDGEKRCTFLVSVRDLAAEKEFKDFSRESTQEIVAKIERLHAMRCIRGHLCCNCARTTLDQHVYSDRFAHIPFSDVFEEEDVLLCDSCKGDQPAAALKASEDA